MPAHILIHSGPNPGATHCIDHAVTRIGSDPSADFVIPDASLEPHVLTVETKDGNHRAYNRCERTLYLGNLPLEPGCNMPWPDSDLVELSDEVTLAREYSETPIGISVGGEQTAFVECLPGDFEDCQETEITAIPSPPQKRAGSLGPVFVIVFCVLGVVGLLAWDRLKYAQDNQSAATRSRLTIAEVVGAAESGPSSQAYVARLQEAETLLLRGQKKLARDRFLRLFDSLSAERPAGEFESMKAFIQSRLGSI